MDIFSLITLGGGLAFFLYGMHVMSAGLEKMSGGKLEKLLRRMTDNPLKGLVLGMVITVAIQSSSALTVMLVGLVNSGIMSAAQTVGAILGAHIGTTVTAWILSLSGISSEIGWLKLLKPECFSLVFALAGALMILMSKKRKRQDLGGILVGFAVLMYGMKLMQDSMVPLTASPSFVGLLTLFENPLLSVLIGTLFTGLVQSSAAAVGILQALALTGSISYGMAIPLIVGVNIGTCVTALISSIGVSREARKVSVIHIVSNALAAAVLLLLFYGIGLAADFGFIARAIDPVGIALVHTVFNLASTLLWLPFMRQLEPLADRLLPRRKGGAEVFLDERLLRTPSVALQESMRRTCEMARIAEESVLSAFSLLSAFDEAAPDRIRAAEDETDRHEDKLGSFLVSLSSCDLSPQDGNEVTRMLHAITDFERLSDHAVNILEAAEEMKEKALCFSPEAAGELAVLLAALREIVAETVTAFTANDSAIARRVEPLEQVIDSLTDEIKDRHVQRLQKGACTLGIGFVLYDLLADFERISDHCSNIAVSVIELSDESVESHDYLNRVKSGASCEYNELFREYQKKYSLEG